MTGCDDGQGDARRAARGPTGDARPGHAWITMVAMGIDVEERMGALD
jgi:hypothetical protein